MENIHNIAELTMADLNLRPDLTVEEFDAWRDAQHDSPVDPAIRLMTRGCYSLQAMRIDAGNKAYAQLRAKLGIEPGETDDPDKQAAKILEVLREHYEKITKAVPNALSSMKFKAFGVFSSYAEYHLVKTYINLLELEMEGFKQLKNELRHVRIYTEFIEPNLPGVGPAVAGLLLSSLNPYKARHVSSFWKYLGLDVLPDGTGRSRREAHQEESWMKVRQGDGYVMKKVRKLTHDPQLKSKIVEVMTGCMLKAGVRWLPATASMFDETPDLFRRVKKLSRKEAAEFRRKNPEFPEGEIIDLGEGRIEIRQIAQITNDYVMAYYEYKNRKANSDQPCIRYRKQADGTVKIEKTTWRLTTDGHRDRAAKRFMAKLVIRDLWVAWRKQLGLPVTEPYHVAFLGMKPHGQNGRIQAAS